MENEKIVALAGVLGLDPTRLAAALEVVDREEGQKEVGGGTLDNFYFNPNVFMRLHSIDYAGLRKLVVPNLRRLRR